jgi:DMSO/TMAO reductase YedYZ molybdopterin-dependent catalytic subunit
VSDAPTDAAATIRDLLHRADGAAKAAPSLAAPEGARERVARLLEAARDQLRAVGDEALRLELAGQVARRAADLDRATLDAVLVPTPGVRRAPTRVRRSGGPDGGVDPARVPPNQHLTPGWPVLHVGAAPTTADAATWRVVVTGRVTHRVVATVDELRDQLPVVRTTSDLHCVTGWSRLDNGWEGVRLVDLLALAGPRPEATHVLASGHPAYSAGLDLAGAGAPDVVVAWAHDGAALDRAHGGPVRLVVPARYGWKSVKWLTELRLLDRDVRGYWEERGYHDRADPWGEERFRS